MYEVDWDKFAEEYMPIELRQEFNVAFVQMLLSPLYNMSLRFARLREQIDYELSLGPSVWQLEKVANDRFDPDQRRIYIEQVQPVEPPYSHDQADERVLHLPFYLRSDEYYDQQPDYVVRSTEPLSHVAVDELSALLTRYELPTVIHKIDLS